MELKQYERQNRKTSGTSAFTFVFLSSIRFEITFSFLCYHSDETYIRNMKFTRKKVGLQIFNILSILQNHFFAKQSKYKRFKLNAKNSGFKGILFT
jgi:hypothetical protein